MTVEPKATPGGVRPAPAGGTSQAVAAGYEQVRIGHFEFLNGYPLYYGLERGSGWNCFKLVRGVPTYLNRMLLGGELDISPISSIEYAGAHDRLILFPQLSITSDGAVDSIQLISRVPMDSIRSVAVTGQSATSVVLLRILLEQGRGLRPSYQPLMSEPADALKDHDAVLLIGDQALEACYRQRWDYSWDLGQQWKKLTGLPMVFALWAARRSFYEERLDETHEVQDRLLYSVDYCRANWGEVVSAAARHYPFEEGMLISYFSKLRYDFSDDYQLGLEEFYRRAAQIGATQGIPALEFIGEGRRV